MRVFQKGNWSAKQDVCPICKTAKEGEVTLVSISGTNKDGGFTFEAKQIHLDCIDLMLVTNFKSGKEYLLQEITGG